MEEIKIVSINDPLYPYGLKKIPSPPKLLYVRGNIGNAKEKCLAVVGARRCSNYGKQAASEIVRSLAQSGFTIISGLARGIDGIAHWAALEGGGKTIAVLGSGIDDQSIYPRENLLLAKKILEKDGAIISEYPPGSPISPYNFPKRNRIIAGLSLGTFVVEAKEKSGALITARCANQQKKKIFALPGPFYSLNSRGAHKLIQQGAKLVIDANDILTEFNLPPQLKFNIQKGETKLENTILKIVAKKALHIDNIIQEVRINAAAVSGALTVLEMKNQVKNLGGNVYIMVK